MCETTAEPTAEVLAARIGDLVSEINQLTSTIQALQLRYGGTERRLERVLVLLGRFATANGIDGG